MNSITLLILRLAATFFLLHIGFLGAFLIRYNLEPPQRSIQPYWNSWVFLALIFLGALTVCDFFKSRFMSSWHLFSRAFLGLAAGTLVSIAFIYTYRSQWGAFPTSVFVLSFLLNLFLVYKPNHSILRRLRRLQTNVLMIGDNYDGKFIRKSRILRKISSDQMETALDLTDIDQVLVCEEMPTERLTYLLLIAQRNKIEIRFSLALYTRLMARHLQQTPRHDSISAYLSNYSERDEFLIRTIDIVSCALGLVVFSPVLLAVACLVKLTSSGPVIYKQDRVGKDGRIFIIYKFRSMIVQAEDLYGLRPAHRIDPRLTPIGQFLRETHLDELPQLYNILRGDMSLVGPRPENVVRVNTHKALQGVRLAVKPGLTGLAQIHGFYDLHPRHKIKYDYLYIQNRNLRLNLLLLAQTIPAVLQHYRLRRSS